MIFALALMLAMTAPPAPTEEVDDTIGAMSTAAHDKVESEIETFDKKTGHQVVVYIADSTGGEALERYTSNAAEDWQIGNKGKDDGVVLFLFKRDRKARIEVGYGLESDLTDARSGEIIGDDIAPAMKAGDVDRAVEDGVGAILSTLDAANAPADAPKPKFHFFAAVGHAISWTYHAIYYLAGALLLGFVAFYFIFGELVTWFRRGKPHGDWMDDYMHPIAQDQAAGDTGGGGYYHGAAGSSSGGGGGGGGFSGGGGSFGGGGASGGW
jgi:uncharacterized protein